MTPVQQKYCRSIESNYCPIIILSNILEIHVKSFYQNRAVSNRANKCQFSCIWLGYALIKAYPEIQKAEDTYQQRVHTVRRENILMCCTDHMQVPSHIALLCLIAFCLLIILVLQVKLMRQLHMFQQTTIKPILTSKCF